VGTSLVTTIIARRRSSTRNADGHASTLNPNFNAHSSDGAEADARGLSSHEGQQQALARFYQGLQAQAATLAYIDTFGCWQFGAG